MSRKHVKILYLPLSVFLFSVLGCHDNETVVNIPKKPIEWKEHPHFKDLDKLRTTSFSTDDDLYMYGNGFLSKISSNNSVNHYIIFTVDFPFVKYPISEDYFIRFGRSYTITISSAKNPISKVRSVSLSMLDDVDKDFKSFVIGNQARSHHSIVINDNNQCLFRYKNKNDKEFLCLLDIGEGKFNTLKISKITKIDLDKYARTYIMLPHKEGFIVASSGRFTNGYFYKIYNDGSHKKVGNYGLFMTIFSYKNTLYATQEFNNLYISTDDGESWKGYKNYPRDLVLSKYYTVSDSLIAVSRISSDMMSVKLNGARYSATVLQNKGVSGNYITSLCEFRDSVYATSISGVFYKSKKDFFEMKKEN